MKPFLPFTAVAISFLFSLNSNAQASCPVINQNSFQIITNNGNTCSRMASFTFNNPDPGAKRINVVIVVGTTQVIDECIDASDQVGETRTYTSAAFTACDLAQIKLQVTPYTGSDCGSSPCSPVFYSGTGTLPVTLASFAAGRMNETVLLKWETATETNNSGFYIERNNSGSWQTIGFIASKATDGNSHQKLSYQFTDINSNKGMSQYRLKQQDMNGAGKYSDIRTVRGTVQDARTTVFPNPSADGKVTVVFADAAIRDIILTDLGGRMLMQWAGFNGNSLQVPGLPSGMFSLQINNRETGTRSTEKIIITGRQ